MKNSLLIAIGALLLGIAGGYFAGTSGKEKRAAAQEDARNRKTGRSATRPGGTSGQDSQRSGKSSRSLQEVMDEPGQTNRVMALLQYYAELDASQFETEMQKLQGLPMSQRMVAMNLLFARWAESDPEAALEQSRKMDFPEIFMARAGVVSGWAAANPEGLAREYTDNPSEFRMRRPGGRGGGGTVSLIAGEWAKDNPKAALTWARTLEEDEAGSAIGGIFNELAQRDPSEALRMATLLNSTERMEAYRSIAESWAITDYAAADSWINGLNDEEKAMARVEAVEALAEIDPRKASVEVAKVPEGAERDRLVAEVSREWAREDPTAALAYLTDSGSDGAVEEGIGSLMGRLAGENADQALDWIDEQPVGQVRDNALQGYVFGNREAAPADSIPLAESISDAVQRTETVERIAYRWIRDDAEAALNYVESSTVLSDESKGRMIAEAERIAEGGGDRPFGRGRPPGAGRGR